MNGLSRKLTAQTRGGPPVRTGERPPCGTGRMLTIPLRTAYTMNDRNALSS